MNIEGLKIENAAVRIVDLPVRRIEPETQSFIVEFEGEEYPVAQEPVQKNLEQPQTICCQISRRQDGGIKIIQNIEKLIAEYLPVGTITDFSVKSDFRLGADGTYELQDCKYGFIAYLKNAGQYHFFKGQILKCRIEGITGRRPAIRLMEVHSSMTQNAFSIAEDRFLEMMGSRIWDRQSLIDLLLSSAMDSDFTTDCLTWVLRILQQTPVNPGDDPTFVLTDVRDCCLTMLETTNLLTRIGMQERQMLVGRFTTLIEQVGYVHKAVTIGNKKDRAKFVGDIIYKLRTSGCLYHPVKNFGIMTSIFTLDKSLMEQKIEDIFELICSRDLNYWRQDPFRREFIRLLEIYIHRTDAVISQLENKDKRIDHTFRALAIELLLMDKSLDQDLVDSRLNHSMFYRYASYRNQASDLISAAFGNLCGSVQQLTFNNLGATTDELLAFHITTLVNAKNDESDARYTFNTGSQQLIVADEGISITTVEECDKRTVLANDLLPWNNLQVLLKKKPKSAAQAQNNPNIRPYASMWADIMTSLFPATPIAKPVAEVRSKKKPTEGDEVFISVVRPSASDESIYHFVIDDPEYETMEGWLDTKEDVAGYYAFTHVNSFCDDYGKPLHLLALIDSINEDKQCHFRIIECLKEFDKWYNFEYDNHRICFVGDVNPSGCFCVAEDGVPVFIAKETPNLPPLRRGDIIEVTGLHDDGYKRLQADECRLTALDREFDIRQAFARLMRNYAEGNLYIFQDSAEQEEEKYNESDMDIIMEPTHVRELMLLIERIASLSGDHVKAYNYLAVARVLAKMLKLDDQERYYYGQMKMIEFLNEFELNDRNDEDRLGKFYDDYKEFFDNYANLRTSFKQLEFLSYLGRPECNAALWSAQNSDENNERLCKIAKLVLSYNFLMAEGMLREAEEAQERVKTLLNLRTRQSNLKSYGKEGQSIEFKMSILFPPASSNPRPQMETILRVITSFLNTGDGGTLYVGVNDSGMGEGVERDLSDPRFFGDVDKYERYLLDNVRRYLGPHADRCCHVEWEDANERKVMVVRVERCPYLVLFNGICYERNNSRIHAVEPHELQEFMKQQKVTLAPETTFHASSAAPKATAAADYVTTETTNAFDVKSNLAANVATSRTMNRLADGTTEHPRYLQIAEDGRSYMLADSWPGVGAVCLGFDDTDIDMFLVAVWEDGTITRTPMEYFVDDQQNWVPVDIKNPQRLIFIGIAGKDDALMFFYRSKIRRYLRVDTVKNLFATNNLSQNGRTVTDTQIDSIITCELIPKKKTNKIKTIHDCKPDNPGMDVKEKSALFYQVEAAIGYELDI